MEPTPAPTPPPATQNWGGPSGPRANFGYRLLAVIIDGIIIAIVYGIVIAAAGVAAGYAVGIVFSLVYIIALEGSSSGQTFGKKVVGIRIVDANTGGPIGYGRAFIRYIGKIVSGIPCYLGYLWMLWDKEKQCWDDKFANDYVVPVQHYPVKSWPGF